MLSKNHAGATPPKTTKIKLLSIAFIFLSALALSFIGIGVAIPPAPGVVADLHCNEGSGTSTADVSGNNHNGTLTNGPTWGAGKYGQGINLDGTNDYVNIADHANFTLTPTLSYTWSGWIKNNNFNQWSTVWSQTVSSSNYFYFYAHTSTDGEAGPVTNGISVYWYSGSNKLVIHSNNNVLTAGQWSYVAVTYDASQALASRFTIFVNGADVTNRTDVVSAGTLAAIDPTNIRIGSNQPFGEYLNGSVDEIRYYRRLLSLAEIQGDMNTGNTPDQQAPTVNITAPAAGNVSGTLNVTANAGDNIGVAGVQFLLDGNSLGAEDIASPYSVSWNTITATNGSHNLTARARDAAGNTTTSVPVVVNVNNDITSPTVSVTPPATSPVSGTIAVEATADDNVGVVSVQFLLDGNTIGAEDISSPYSVSWNTTTAVNGNHNLTARARDAAGNTKTSDIVAVVVNNVDGQPPTVNITAPAAGNVSGTINVNANAGDNIGVMGVQFLLDGINLGAEDITASYAVSWDTKTATNGSHSLTATARDAAGNTTTSVPVIVNVNNDLTSPTVSVTPPASSPVSGTITVGATANDNVGVVGVQFLLNGASLGTEDLAAPYSVSWNTTGVTNTTYIITARARDAAGNITTSADQPFTVLNNNLVVALAFNETSGPTANDNSGNNNTGTLTNGPTRSASGKYGGAVLFDGSNDFVNIADANSLDLTNGMTIEAWVNPSNLTGYKTVICKDNGTNNLSYVLSANNNTSGAANQRPNSRIRIGSNTRTVTGTTKLTLNIWTHIASTYDGTTMRLYINGIQVSTFATTGNMTATANPLRIGGSTALGSQYFTGLIDEVRVYNRALTAAQIQADMTTPIAPDITNPIVNITAPAPGNVSGTINVTASASDNIAVTGVQFLLDGSNLGAEVTTAPYVVSWNTETSSNDNHILTARARDAAGNTTISPNINVTTVADFSFTVLNPTRNVNMTGSTNFGVGITYLNGFASNEVALSVTGLPANVTGDYLVNPLTNPGQTQLNISSTNATPGTYTLNLSATAQGITHSQQATLIVNPAADFTLSSSPAVQTVTAGNGTSYVITVGETGDYTSPVTLSVQGLPAGANASFNPGSVTPVGTSVLTITTSGATPAGTYSLTVQGATGALTHTATISLTVSSSPPVTWPVTTIGSNWDMPIGAAFTKDGQKLFVWEKGGKVFVCNRNPATQLYDKQTTPVLDISPEVGNWGDHGLLGFALDPNFASNGLIYLLYVVDRHYLMNFGTPNYNPATTDKASENQATIGRITRYKTISSGGNLLTDLSTRAILLGETRFTGIPLLHDSHGLGTLAFAADGTLISSAGDGADYNTTDAGSDGNTYYSQALTDGIIRSEENVGAFRSQLLNSHNGKLLRIDPTNGNGVSSNPFYSASEPRAPKSRVWALGFRNPYRFSIRPGTGSANPAAGDIGEIYVGDVGMRIYEELSIVKAPGMNCGWPLFEGLLYHRKSHPSDISDFVGFTTQNKDEPNPLFGINGCTQQYFAFRDLLKQAMPDGSTTIYNPCNPAIPIGTNNRYVHRRPSLDWKHDEDSARVGIFIGNNAGVTQLGTAASNATGSPFRGNCSIGGFWYTGNLFPANFRNTYFHADYGAQWIKAFTIGFTDVVQKVENFTSGLTAIVCLVENPLDGTLVYVDIGINAVKTIGYGGNQVPVVKMTSDVKYGPTALNVNFSGSNSFDPDGGNLTYLWNFGDATTSTLANPSHSFTSPVGTPKKFTVTLTVKDNQNATATDSIIISVNNTPPQVHITSPANNSNYVIGPDSIYLLTAAVSDAEHSPSQLKYAWQKVLRHDNHEHPGPIDTARNSYTTIARIGCNGDSYYWLIRLKVTDAAGLSTSDSSKIFPDCSSARMPLVLRKFSVTQEAGINLVKWTTDMAPQIENFDVERSADGVYFFAIDHQQAAKTAGIKEYSFNDINFPAGVNYYRLRMNEIGDVVRYSETVKTFTDIKGEKLVISPNPTTGNFSVRYSAPVKGPVTIRISDISGRLVGTVYETVSKGQNLIYLQNWPTWKPGVYLIAVHQGKDIQHGKLMYHTY